MRRTLAVCSVLALGGVVLACSDDAGRPVQAVSAGADTGTAASVDDGDDDPDAGSAGSTPMTADDGGPTGPGDEGPGADTADDAIDETGRESEYFMLSDPLIDGTVGVNVGGAFGPDGWTTTDRTDLLYWELPRLVTGSIEFTVTNLTIDKMQVPDNEIFSMYEGGYDIEHPINYNPEYRNNHYKSMIRIYGIDEPERTGEQKLMFGICPAGAPGYIEGDGCTCATNFFEEPFGGDPNWSGDAERLRVEWDGSYARLLRNGGVVIEIDYGASGLQFGPQTLYASLGTSRPMAVDTSAMPVGITFSDVLIEGWTGAEQSCG